MADSSKTIHRLIIYTSLCFIALAAVGFWVRSKQNPDKIVLDTKGQPTIGNPNAKVHLVIFEEPKCGTCREFTEKLFPLLKKEYIDTNKILFTAIPVSFLPHSLPAADALMCVYYQDPDAPNSELFFAFLDYMYKHQPSSHKEDWATDDKLIEMAHKANPNIQLRQLRICIDRQAYRAKVAQNTEYARRVMHGDLATPTLYINGLQVKELSYKRIVRLIHKALLQEGAE